MGMRIKSIKKQLKQSNSTEAHIMVIKRRCNDELMAVDIRLRLWPGFSASHDLARSPGVRESNPQPTQGFANPGFNFLTVSADLYLAVLVPWIQ